MRITSFGALLLVLSVAGQADAEWLTNYAQALKQSTNENKPLLVVLDKPNEPLQRIEQISLKADKKQSELLKNYVPVRIDVTSEKGKKLATAFKATSFPYTVVTAKTSRRIIYRNTGTYSKDAWNTMLTAYKSGVSKAVYRSSNSQSGLFRNCFT